VERAHPRAPVVFLALEAGQPHHGLVCPPVRRNAPHPRVARVGRCRPPRISRSSLRPTPPSRRSSFAW
jgi:hypothetical protein